MTIFKCKMCGGTLNIQEGMTVCECEYCGSKQTIPNLDDEKKAKLYERANKLRFNNEFDKAYSVYQDIVNEYSDDAEAYWGLLLCKYGIEYVEDPATHNRIPTCHRSSFESIMDDSDFEMVMENADSISRSVYREEAKKIEEIRKGIIEVSSKEEPYDIFICYKETAEDGQRTIDSVLAQDIYTELTNKGYKVFFSRITLEDKLGQEYEPYIFAALNSAKIMLAFGTSYDHYNAVWVKNEWSRYLQLMSKNTSKHLIPCYKNIDAYDMPKEFAKLQAQDLGKVGATQDLLRGIEKILPLNNQTQNITQVQTTTVIQQTSGPNVESLLKRGNMALEDGDWDTAKKYFNDVLDIETECAEAYLGLSLSFHNCKKYKEFERMFLKGDAIIDKNIKRARKYSSDIDAKLNELEKKRSEIVEKEELMAEETDAIKNEYKTLRNDLFNLERYSEGSKISKIKNEIENRYSNDISLLKESLNSAEKEINDLINQKNRLGFFDGKKKKEIDDKILKLSSSTSLIEGQITSFEEKILSEFNTSKNIVIENEKEVIQKKLEENLIKLDKLKEFPYDVGENFYLGCYQQQNVSWRVLSIKDDELLIISEYIIETKPFDQNNASSKWETCTLRNWLNNEFFEMAFTPLEKSKIVVDDKGDKLSLLNMGKANWLFDYSERKRSTSGTEWAKNNGLSVENGCSPWWLCDDAGIQFGLKYVRIVCSDGRTSALRKSPVNDTKIGVRPVMWISIR